MRILVTLIILLGASVTAVMMVFFREVYSGVPLFYFMIWNLFLAWLPVVFALTASYWQSRKLLLLGAGFLWLLFLPNAPYMLTDLIHLGSRPPVPFLYDLLTLLTFAFLGLFLGIYSLSVMHTLVARRLGAIPGWFFVIMSMGLSGLGVYIGRFLRWNSWDIFFTPQAVISDVLSHLTDLRTMALTFLLAGLLLTVYLLVGWMSPPVFTLGRKQSNEPV